MLIGSSINSRASSQGRAISSCLRRLIARAAFLAVFLVVFLFIFPFILRGHFPVIFELSFCGFAIRRTRMRARRRLTRRTPRNSGQACASGGFSPSSAIMSRLAATHKQRRRRSTTRRYEVGDRLDFRRPPFVSRLAPALFFRDPHATQSGAVSRLLWRLFNCGISWAPIVTKMDACEPEEVVRFFRLLAVLRSSTVN